MSKITKFEELKCWQSARTLVKNVYTFSSKGKIANDYDLKSQLRRAALSTMNNIAEGFSRFHIKDSIHFYDISQSSASELMSMSYVLEDLCYLTQSELIELRENTESTKKITLGFIRYLNQEKEK